MAILHPRMVENSSANKTVELQENARPHEGRMRKDQFDKPVEGLHQREKEEVNVARGM